MKEVHMLQRSSGEILMVTVIRESIYENLERNQYTEEEGGWKLVKGRKEHTCQGCHSPILKGTVHWTWKLPDGLPRYFYRGHHSARFHNTVACQFGEVVYADQDQDRAAIEAWDDMRDAEDALDAEEA